ncbi:hypothetical protein [Roseospirillum parvum]|uniref:Uncharacterized protein n=1 Tax=Roseospirillum parvum TaxID=83401 RepID=A0A1G8ARS3_9PROT|nr:hypothetical protein [Roseospirillum parvum]SDH23668.1 hypothetical protein SAMN05421742_10587 [Roseospirillum parvum]
MRLHDDSDEGRDSPAAPANGKAARLMRLLAQKGEAAPAVTPVRQLRDPARFAGLRLTPEPATLTALAPHPVTGGEAAHGHSPGMPTPNPLTLGRLGLKPPVAARVPVTVRLAVEDYHQLKTVARERGTTMQAIASAAVRERLEAEDEIPRACHMC